jgi:hypothetical protein
VSTTTSAREKEVEGRIIYVEKTDSAIWSTGMTFLNRGLFRYRNLKNEVDR